MKLVIFWAIFMTQVKIGKYLENSLKNRYQSQKTAQ